MDEIFKSTRLTMRLAVQVLLDGLRLLPPEEREAFLGGEGGKEIQKLLEYYSELINRSERGR